MSVACRCFAVAVLLSAAVHGLEAQSAATNPSPIKVKVAFAESESFISSARAIEDFGNAPRWSANSDSPDIAAASVSIRSVDFIPAVGTIEGTNRILGMKATFRKNGEATLIFRPPQPLPLGVLLEAGTAEIRCMLYANNGRSRLLLRISDGKGQSWLAGQSLNWVGWKGCSFPLHDLPSSMAGRSLFIDAVVVYLHPADYSASPLYWYMDSLSVAADPGKSLARPIVGKNGTVAGEAGAADLLKSLIIDPLDQSTFPHWKATRGAGLALSKYLPGETRPGTLQGEVVPDDWLFKLSFGSSLRENEGYSGVKLSVDKPLALPGINKTISAWVRSQSSRVKVYFVVQDLRGFEYELLAGIIDGSGEMKRLTVAVPPWPSLYQKDGRISDRIGLSFIGFDFVPPSSESGSIDIYLLSVVTDTFQSPRDPDWVQGGW